MAEKGYAFVEMATPEQAKKIQETLSETVFEGRRLLIDGVSSKQTETRKWASMPTETRKTERSPERGRDSSRREYPVKEVSQPVETIHHLIDVTDEFKKVPKPDKKPEKPVHKPGQYAASPRDTHKPTPSVPSVRDAEKRTPGQPIREKPEHLKSQQSSPQSPKKSGEPTRLGREPDKKSHDVKPKKIKEKPPKNPHPYQGSKKSNISSQNGQGPDQSSDKEPEDERVSYLKHWATLAGKK